MIKISSLNLVLSYFTKIIAMTKKNINFREHKLTTFLLNMLIKLQMLANDLS